MVTTSFSLPMLRAQALDEGPVRPWSPNGDVTNVPPGLKGKWIACCQNVCLHMVGIGDALGFGTWMDEDFIGRVGSLWHMHGRCTGVTCMGKCGCMKPCAFEKSCMGMCAIRYQG